MREQQTGRAQVGAQRALRRGEADQRAGHGEQRNAHQRRDRHALRVQQVGHDQKIAEERHHGGVAMAARLEQLQAGEHCQQHDARSAAEDRAVLGEDGADRQHGHREQLPARGQGRAGERDLRAPGVQPREQQRQPPGHAQRMRRRDQQQRDDQAAEVARRDGAHLGRERMRLHHAFPCRARACRQAEQ
jgi:hypothetical protein